MGKNRDTFLTPPLDLIFHFCHGKKECVSQVCIDIICLESLHGSHFILCLFLILMIHLDCKHFPHFLYQKMSLIIFLESSYLTESWFLVVVFFLLSNDASFLYNCEVVKFSSPFCLSLFL